MGAELKEDFGVLYGTLRPQIVGDHEPILICSWVKAAKDLSPRELSLAGEIEIDHAGMKGAPLDIIRSVRLVKRMGVRKKNDLHTAFSVGNGFDLEVPVVGMVESQEMM